MIPEDVDLGFILEEEGFNPRAHWPGGRSGVTIGPGIDLGYAELDVVVNALSPHLAKAELKAVLEVRALRLRGRGAKSFLDGESPLAQSLRQIELTREQVGAMLPVAAEPYWVAVAERFPDLLRTGIPGGVKTAFLSLAYNRGAHNPDLEQLRKSLAAGNWPNLVDLIEDMEELPERRAREAELVRNRSHADFLRYFRGYRWFEASEIRRAAGKDVPAQPWQDAERALLILDAAREASGVPIALRGVLETGLRRTVSYKTSQPALVAWHAGIHAGITYGTDESISASFDAPKNTWKLTA